MDGGSFGDEFDWSALAFTAGQVGKFIWYLDSGECKFDGPLQKITGFNDLDSRFPASKFIDQVPFGDQSLVWMALNETLVTNNPYNAEFRFVRSSGEVIWLAGEGQLTEVPGGGQALLGLIYNMTEQRTLLQRSELIAGEMEHRVNNLLSVVTSLYHSSARTAGSIEELTEAFLPRLSALSALNDLAARSGHQEINVVALVEAAMQPVTGRGVTCHVDGSYINGKMAQVLTLMLNELTTNAMKFGGLASSAAKVTVEVLTDDDLFTLIWTEIAGYEVRAPVNPTGIGMEVLNNLASATFNGRPQLMWLKEGLTFKCEWPLDQVTAL